MIIEKNPTYCRYCSFCIPTDCEKYYCTVKKKELPNKNGGRNCDEFALSEIGDVDNCNIYQPRKPQKQQSNKYEQIKLF